MAGVEQCGSLLTAFCMANAIYSLPLRSIYAAILVGMLLWGFLWTKMTSRTWRNVNLCLLVLFLAGVLYLTIFDRSGGTYDVLLHPFALLKRALEQREYFRTMLMNVFLFFPLGLTLSNVLPWKWKRWGRIALTAALCCALSVLIEYTQYWYHLGVAETDDVICNTLGSFLGACSLLVAWAIERCQEKRDAAGDI